jgi:hypothetical protein
MKIHSDEAWGIASQYYYTLESETKTLAAQIDILVNKKLDHAAYLARHACLVPPDGGSPTEDEAAVCDEAAKRILAQKHVADESAK